MYFNLNGMGDTASDAAQAAAAGAAIGAAINTGTVNACDPSTTPCSWLDDIYVRDSCLSWLRQCNPTDPKVIAMDAGFVAGTAAYVGQAVAAGGAPLAGAAGKTAGNALAGLFNGLFVNTDGSTNWVTVGVAGIAAVFAFKTLKGR